MRTKHKASERSIPTDKIPRFDRLRISEVWRHQDGEYFCASTKDRRDGKWKDHWFQTWQFSLLPQFLESNLEKDVYFCIHGFSDKKRMKEYAVPSKVLWADLDEVDPLDLPRDFEPTISFETSPGRYSALWVMDDYVTEELNKRLTYHVGADKTGWANTKVLRVVPGLKNYKYEDAPRVRYVFRDGPTHIVNRFERLLPKLETTLDCGPVKRKPWTGTKRALLQLAAKYRVCAKMMSKPSNGDLSGQYWGFGKEVLRRGGTVAEAVAIASNSQSFKLRYAGNVTRAQLAIDRLWEKYPIEKAKLKNEGRAT